MARAYQEAHMLDSLNSNVKALQTQTADLLRTKGLHEERIKTLTTETATLTKKNAELETRVKADEHNHTARVQNGLLAQSPNPNHTPLTPLHDVRTNRPIRHFPRHEKDVRTLPPADVIQVLQALDVKTLGMSSGEKKGELRVQVGLLREQAGGG